MHDLTVVDARVKGKYIDKKMLINCVYGLDILSSLLHHRISLSFDLLEVPLNFIRVKFPPLICVHFAADKFSF